MSALRIGIGTLLAWQLLTGAAAAEERRFSCPAEGFTVYRDAGLAGALDVVLRSGEPGTIELHGLWGDIVLPAARVDLQPEVSFGEATAELPLPVPDRAAVDACIAEAEKKDPQVMKSRRDADLLSACKAAAPLDRGASVALTFQIIAFSRDSPAQAIIKRAYAGEDDEGRRRHGVDTMVACAPLP
jgi:hypothetical protein